MTKSITTVTTLNLDYLTTKRDRLVHDMRQALQTQDISLYLQKRKEWRQTGGYHLD